jgi:hypothetical protein
MTFAHFIGGASTVVTPRYYRVGPTRTSPVTLESEGETMRKAIQIAVMVAVTGIAFAQQPAPASTDPYSVVVSTSPAPGGPQYFFVTVTVTEKATGNVVHAPRVQTAAGVDAEITSDPDTNGRSFEERISVSSSGKASVVFKAYEHIIQHTRVSS